MESIFEFFSLNPLALVAASIASAVVLFFFLKKALKVLLVLCAFLVLYMGWLFLTGGELHPLVLQLQDRVIELYGQLLEFMRASTPSGTRSAS